MYVTQVVTDKETSHSLHKFKQGVGKNMNRPTVPYQHHFYARELHLQVYIHVCNDHCKLIEVD